jgi:hypothetical protein
MDLVAVGIVPFLYLIAAFLVFERIARSWSFPEFIDRAIFHLQGLFSIEVTLAASVLLGVAIGAAVRGRDEPDATANPTPAWR